MPRFGIRWGRVWLWCPGRSKKTIRVQAGAARSVLPSDLGRVGAPVVNGEFSTLLFGGICLLGDIQRELPVKSDWDSGTESKS